MSHTRKRLLLFDPEIQPRSFVLFFEQGNSGVSYSIRDYSEPGAPHLRYAQEFRDRSGNILPADELIARAKIVLDAQPHPTADLKHWYNVISDANATHLGSRTGVAPSKKAVPTVPSRAGGSAASLSFPILDYDELSSLPKSSKRGDMDRIMRHPNSEDYVTWNWSRLLHRLPPVEWWPRLAKLAGFTNMSEPPEVRLWQLVASPKDYELQSRRRMTISANPLWAARAKVLQPVEGSSEIDISFHGREYLVFVEAKLGSDISLNTTYDPTRDQITRNIDCLLESAMGRTAYFWLCARDDGDQRAYVQLVREFRRNPESLWRKLPHRDPAEVRHVCNGLSIVLWRDLLEIVTPASEGGGLEMQVLAELNRRARTCEQ